MDFISTSPQPAALLVLADAAIKSATLLVVAGIASPLMRKSSAAARHVLWSGALSGALLLPVLSFFLPAWRVPWLPDWTPPSIIAPVSNPVASTTPTIEPHPVAAQPSENSLSQATPIIEASAVSKITPTQNAQQPARVIHWRDVLLFLVGYAEKIWLIAAALALMPMLAGWIQAALVTRRGRPLKDASWNTLLDDVTRELKLRRPVRLLACTGAAMPFTWGAWRPVVIFPETVAAWSESRRRIVLLHELAHVERWDWLTQTLAVFACALYWFNPLAWLAAKRMRIEREQACDDLVLRAGSRPSDYADELLQLAATARHSGFLNFAAVPMARHSTLESRLRAILDGKRNRATLTRAAALAALALTALIVVPVAMLRAAPSEAQQNTPIKAGPAVTSSNENTPAPPSITPDAPSLTKLGAGSHENEAMLFITLKNVQAKDLAATLNTLKNGPLLSHLGNSTAFQTDARTNQLIVITDKSSAESVQNIIKSLDVKTPVDAPSPTENVASRPAPPPPQPPSPPSLAPGITPPVPADSTANDKVPVLGDVPFLGNLVSTNGQTNITSSSTITSTTAPATLPAPSSSPVTLTGKISPAIQQAINQLLVKGKAEYLYGDFQASLDTFNEVSSLDPEDIVAKAYIYDIKKILAENATLQAKGAQTPQYLLKMRSITIPDVNYDLVPIDEFFRSLSVLSQHYDPDQSHNGVNIVVVPRSDGTYPKVSVHLKGVNLEAILKTVAEMTGYRYTIGDDGNITLHEGSGAGPSGGSQYLFRPFSLSPDAETYLANLANATASTPPNSGNTTDINNVVKNGLIKLGVPFPPGSALLYNADLHKIGVFNTSANLDKIAADLAEFAQPASNDVVPATSRASKDDTNQLLLKGESRYSLGDYNGARETFNQVLAIDPDNVAAKAYLSNIQRVTTGAPLSTNTPPAFNGSVSSTDIPLAMQKGQVKAVVVQGDVTLTKADGTTSKIKRNETFGEGDTIATDTDGTALLVFSNGASLKIDNKALMKVTQFQQSPFDESKNGTYLRLEKDPSKSTVVLDVFHGTVAGEIKQLNVEAGSTFTINYHGASANVTSSGVLMRGATINNFADTAGGEQMEINVPTNPPTDVFATITSNDAVPSQSATQSDVDAIYQTLNAARVQDGLPPIETPKVVAPSAYVVRSGPTVLPSPPRGTPIMRFHAWVITYPADTKLEIPDNVAKIDGYLSSVKNLSTSMYVDSNTTSGYEVIHGLTKHESYKIKPQLDNGNVSYTLNYYSGNNLTYEDLRQLPIVSAPLSKNGTTVQLGDITVSVAQGTTPLNHATLADVGFISEGNNNPQRKRAVVLVFSDGGKTTQGRNPPPQKISPSISGSVTISGEVNKPTLLPVPTEGNLTVSQAILTAGGFTEWAKHTVKLIHVDKDGKRTEQSVDIDAVLNGHPEKDVKVESGDIIFVDKKLLSFE